MNEVTSPLAQPVEQKVCITQEALLTMPADDYMNDDQLYFFKCYLNDQLSEIREEIHQARERLAPDNSVGDEADLASNAEMQQLDIRIIERKTKLARKIESALRRIDNHDYGYCVETGEPIGIPRLLARPTAMLSINSKEHQEFHEVTDGYSNLGKDSTLPPDED